MADGRVTMPDGPPAKKAKTASPATGSGLDSSDLSMLLTKVNQALPDELASIASPLLAQQPISASQNGSDRAAETILKNRNLSNLLNSDNVPRAPPNAVSMLHVVGGRYPNMRHQGIPQQQRQMLASSELRAGMAQPPSGQLPMYVATPSVHLARGSAVGYGPSRHPADVMRSGVGFDGARRQFVNPGSSYFMNGPAMMNGAPRLQGGGYPPGGPPMASFPAGPGQFGMSGYSGGGNPGHGSMYPGMIVPSEAGQAFSPGIALSLQNSFVSAGTTNCGPVVCSRNIVSVPSPAPVVSVVSTQLLNGSCVPSSTLAHKPLTELDAQMKGNTSVSGPSSLPLSTLNCQRFSSSTPEVTSSVSSRQTSYRQLPTPEKDGNNMFGLETSLVSPAPPDGVTADIAGVGPGISSVLQPSSSSSSAAGSVGSLAGAMTEKGRLSLVQQQLVLVLHAHKCQRREQQLNSAAAAGPPCALPNCANMKNKLKHMTVCKEGKNCAEQHCSLLRQIIWHWKNCSRPNCPICSPLKNASDRRLTGAVVTTTAAISSSPPPTASTVVTTVQNDVMLRMYKTLGIDPPSTSAVLTVSCAVPSTALSRCNGLPATSDTVTSLSLSSTEAAGKTTKDWHQSVGQDLRNHLVHKLVQAIFPTNPDPSTLRDWRMNHLVQYARKVEGDMYETAASREEYYHLLAEKIYKIQKELEEKRMQRIKEQGAGSGTVESSTATTLSGSAIVPSTGSLTASPAQSPSFEIADTLIQSEYPDALRCSSFQHLQQPQPPYMMTAGSGVPHGRSQHMPVPVGMDVTDPSGIPRFRGQPYPGAGPPGMYFRLVGPRHEVQQMYNVGQDPQQSNYQPPYHQLDPSFSYRMNVPDNKPQEMLARQRCEQQPLLHSSSSDSVLFHDRVPVSSSASGPETPLHHLPVSLPLAQSETTLLPPASTPPSPKQTADKLLVDALSPSGDVAATPAGVSTSSSPHPVVKQEIQHEDITDDEAPVKTSAPSPSAGAQAVNGFKAGLEDITDDESEVKPDRVEVKTEVKEESGTPKDGKSPKVEVKTEPEEAGEASGLVDVKEEIKEEDSSADKSSISVEGANKSTDVGRTSLLEEEGGRKVWKASELQQALNPIIDKLWALDPEALPFRNPVDPEALCIPDYFDVVQQPMDLSTIREKLNIGEYSDPWACINDIQLMFDNAWLYNRKTSKVYKYCSKLAEVFEAEIDGVMRSLGYCCGRKHIFSPQVLCCYGKQLCSIPRDTVFYNYQNRYMYCEKCFNELPEDGIDMADDPLNPGLKLRKAQFIREKNDKLEYEPFIECKECGRAVHRICVLYLEHLWPSGFMCENCRARNDVKRPENKFVAKRLPPTKLGTYLESRVNSLLKRKDAGAGEVTIRVLSSYDKAVDVKPGMRARFSDMAESFPYRVKAMFAFEEIDGVDVCFFGMHVQEYGSDCSPPNTRRVYIAYLDSVYFFQPKQFRTAVYHEILIGYMDYAKSLGFQTAHIWACPPSEGDDYIFHCHPPEQKIPKPKRLQDWYRRMLDKAMADRVICDYKDILKDALENNLTSVTEMPYFEGDFWPNILEESIKEVEQEELEKRRREEEEAAADTDDGEPSVHGDRVELQPFAGKKKGQKSGNTKKKNTKCKKQVRKSKTGGSDLTGKLLSTMEKLKDGFFVIRLQSNTGSASDLQDIKDPDPLMNCDLMDGRDAFLTMSRDKHYEFSSLRRAKYSTAGMLHELHNQARDSFAYVCNACKASVETRYHCTTCDDFDLCVACYKTADHPHRMVKLGLDLDDGTTPQPAASDSTDSDNKSATLAEARRVTYAQLLAHSCHCRNANCMRAGCLRMQGLVTHIRNCDRKQKGCQTCRQMLLLCCQHARSCTDARCPVPFCPKIRESQERRRREQLFQQQQLVRRRVANMQRSMYMASAGDERDSTPQPVEQHADKGQHVSGKSPPSSAQHAAQQAQRQANNVMMRQQPMSRLMPGMDGPGACWPQQGVYGPGQPGLQPMPDDMLYQKRMMLGGELPPHMQPSQQMMPQQGMPTNMKMQRLLETLSRPQSPHQQQEVQNFLKTNPDVMATAIKQGQLPQQLSTSSLNSQMMSGGSIMRSPIGPAGVPHMNMPMGPNVGSQVVSGMGGAAGPAASGSTVNGPVHRSMAMPGQMGPGMMVTGPMAGPVSGSGPVGNAVMEPTMVDEAGHPVMMSQSQMRMWQQQHMLRATQHQSQQCPPPEYGRFPSQVISHRAAAAAYCGNVPTGIPPQSQRMRMNMSAVSGSVSLPTAYPGGDSLRGPMTPLLGGTGPNAMSMQHSQMMQMTQRQHAQLRGQSSSLQQPAMMMDPSSMAQRPISRRAPPPHYADTVLAHSGPRLVSSIGSDAAQFTPDSRMRFRPPNADFGTAPITATDVVRYPVPHDSLSRFSDGQ